MDGTVELLAPTLWLYEGTNALRTAVIRKRIEPEKALDDLSHFLRAKVKLVLPEQSRFGAILTDAISYQLSVYDASYIDLARETGHIFYTGDKKLYNALCKELPFIRWIDEYNLEQPIDEEKVD